MLVVKGTKAEAAKAAAERGIDGFVPLYEFLRWGETVGTAPGATTEVLQQWFHEHESAPFPPGALLLFSPDL